MPRATDDTFDVDEDGRITDRRRAEWVWSQIKLYAGRKVRIRISSPKRSTRANAYYWSCIIEPIRLAMMEAGHPHSAETIHRHFKALYLAPIEAHVAGIDHVWEPTTTDLDSTAFSEYIAAIREDETVRAMNVYFPEPEPDEYQEEYGTFKSYAIAEPA